MKVLKLFTRLLACKKGFQRLVGKSRDLFYMRKCLSILKTRVGKWQDGWESNNKEASEKSLGEISECQSCILSRR